MMRLLYRFVIVDSLIRSKSANCSSKTKKKRKVEVYEDTDCEAFLKENSCLLHEELALGTHKVISHNLKVDEIVSKARILVGRQKRMLFFTSYSNW